MQRASPCSPPCAASSALATLSALPRREPLPMTSATSSLSPSAAAPMVPQLLARPIVGRQVFHLTLVTARAQLPSVEPRILESHVVDASRSLLSLAVLAAVAGAACGDPPDKEMQQAQGAIDAARAAGADQYAREEFTAAEDALKRSHDAVAQRDYRQALNDALDAASAPRPPPRKRSTRRPPPAPTPTKALADADAALHDARAKLKAAEAAHAPARTLASGRKAIDNGESAVQEARTAFDKGDYLGVDRDRRSGVPAALGPAAHDLDAADRRRRAAGGTERSAETDRAGRGASTRNLPEPVAVDEDLGPAGQVDAVVAPLDALPAARRDDRRRRAPRRRTPPPRSATRTTRSPTTSSARRRAPRSGSGRVSGASTCANSTLVRAGNIS